MLYMLIEVEDLEFQDRETIAGAWLAVATAKPVKGQPSTVTISVKTHRADLVLYTEDQNDLYEAVAKFVSWGAGDEP